MEQSQFARSDLPHEVVAARDEGALAFRLSKEIH